MTSLMVFVLGVVIGAVALIVVSFAFAPKVHSPSSSEQGKIKNALKELELIGSIKYRMEKVNELTQTQLSLLSQIDRPSASASHSRYKNDIVRQMKQIEEEKITIFRSILKDGFDPNLSVQIDGKVQSLKMSEVIAMYDKTQPSQPLKKTDSISPRDEKRLRLVIDNKGSQNEQSSKPRDPTLH